MPARTGEIQATYEVVNGLGKPNKGRVLKVTSGNQELGVVNVYPQATTLWGGEGFDLGIVDLLVTVKNGQITEHRFEKRSKI